MEARRFGAASVPAALLLVVFGVTPSYAAGSSTRTFVSGEGTDTGLCSRTAPCRSFSYAIGVTSAGGEIVVLDSAGYGPFTINQSVTISNPLGVDAAITASSGDGIQINAGAGTVTLRGLTIDGAGTGTNGIEIASNVASESTATVNIIDCTVKNFSQDGILADPTSGSLAFLDLVIQSTVALDNGDAGIRTNAPSVYVRAAIYQTTSSGNVAGVSLGGAAGGNAVIANSHVDFNTTSGIDVANSLANLLMRNSTANSNGTSTAEDVETSGAVKLLNHNAIGTISVTGGSTESDGTNAILDIAAGSISNIGVR